MGIYFQNPNVDYEVGYDTYPNRKRPQIVIKTGNVAESYGSFRDEEAAKEYMTKLANLLGIKEAENNK